MDTFHVISIVPVEHLSPLLRWLEARQLPYNVELHNVKKPPEKRQTNGGLTGKALILELLTKKPMSVKELGDAFVLAGRKRQNCHGPLHQLRNDKTVISKNGKYILNKGAAK